ncbi:MAG: BrnT family toxin [Trichlorobacter sp.]|jgi:hypothetical protein
MDYEWDENKRRINLEKHGLDLADANMVYEAENKLTLQSRTAEEARLQDIADIDGNMLVLTCVYTLRSNAVRFISFRHASRKERVLYYGKNG